MKVEILGPGCPKCKKLYERAVEAKKELPPEVEIEKVEDINRLVQLGIWSSPGIVIDGRVVSHGRVPSTPEIVQMIRDQMAKGGA